VQRNEQLLERLELLHRAAQRFQPNTGQNSEAVPGCSSSSNGGGVIAKCERARSEFSRRRCERVQLPSPRGSAERRNFDGHEEDEEQNIHCQTNKQTEEPQPLQVKPQTRATRTPNLPAIVDASYRICDASTNPANIGAAITAS